MKKIVEDNLDDVGWLFAHHYISMTLLHEGDAVKIEDTRPLEMLTEWGYGG